jgi:hypothetical protein
MKSVFVIIGVIVVILMFGVMISGIKSAQTAERIDLYNSVTGGGDFDTDVVLVGTLYDDDLLNATITSDNALDAPVPTLYVPLTRTLTVSGLVASDTRQLTVTYLYGSLTGAAASAGTFLGITPLLVAVGVLLLIVAVLVTAFKSRH